MATCINPEIIYTVVWVGGIAWVITIVAILITFTAAPKSP